MGFLAVSWTCCRPFLRVCARLWPESWRLRVFTLNMQITFVHAARVVVYAWPDSIISSLCMIVSSEHEHLQLTQREEDELSLWVFA